MKYYRISENELESLLRDSHYLRALESGGVDNWGWYGESIYDYKQEMIQEYNLKVEDDYIDMDEFVEEDLKKYKIIEGE